MSNCTTLMTYSLNGMLIGYFTTDYSKPEKK